MTGSATPVIVGALLFLCLAAAVALGGAFYAWRWARRRWLVARAAVRHLERAWTATRAGRTLLGRWGYPPSTGPQAAVVDRRTAPPPRLRRQMWREVDEAEEAVRGAAVAGAPVGDLPSLQGRLRDTASLLDGLLARPQLAGSAAGDRVWRQVADVRATAVAIRSAAEEATAAVVSEAAELRLRGLVADTDREVHSLAAGVDRLTGRP